MTEKERERRGSSGRREKGKGGGMENDTGEGDYRQCELLLLEGVSKCYRLKLVRIQEICLSAHQ